MDVQEGDGLWPLSVASLCVSGDLVSNTCGQAVIGISLSMLVERALVDQISVNSRLCVVRLGGSVLCNGSPLKRRCILSRMYMRPLIAVFLRPKTNFSKSSLDYPAVCI